MSEKHLLIIYTVGGITIFILICAFIAQGLHKLRNYCANRFEERIAEYLAATDGSNDLGEVKFTTYAGFIAWVDQHAWTIPVRERHTEEAIALIRDLASMTFRYAFLAYGCLFIPILVWIDKARKVRKVRRMAAQFTTDTR